MRRLLFCCLLICSTYITKNTFAQSSTLTCKSLFSDPYDSLKKKLPRKEIETLRSIEEIALGKGEFLVRARSLLERLEVRLEKYDHSPSIVDYASLAYLFKTNILETLGLNQRLKILLSKSYEKITGQVPSEKSIGRPLPKKYIKSLQPEVQIFYNASFRHGSQSYKEYLSYIKASDYVIFAAISILAMTATAFHNLGGKYIAAAMAGLAITSFAEYAFHRYGAHASQGLRNLPVIGRLFKEIQFNHSIVHHGVTYKKYTEQFNSPSHKSDVDNFIEQKIEQHGFGEKYKPNLVEKSEYGLILSKKDYLSLVVPISSLTALTGYFLGFDPVMLTLVTVPTFFYPAGVNFVHRYMHLPRQKILEKTSNRAILRKLLDSRYGTLMAQIHYIHHKKVGTNFNLLYPFADIILGTMRLPNLKDLAEMRRQDGLGLTWGDLKKSQTDE